MTCAWCPDFKRPEPGDTAYVSHGMCAKCFAQQVKLLEEAKREEVPNPSWATAFVAWVLSWF